MTMSKGPQQNEDIYTDIAEPWEKIAPLAVFSGMTLPQFKDIIQPSVDARKKIKSLDIQTTTEIVARNNADVVTLAGCHKAVNGVKSHPDFGENSPLYKAMGYVPTDERKSGLVRATAQPAPPEEPPAQAVA